jgi:hypothetical protein
MCEDFAQNFGDKRTGCCIMTTHRLTLPFLKGNFLLKNNMTVAPNLPNFYLCPQLEIKFEGCHFDTNEVTETESQGVLNTLTERDFQDAFKKWQKLCERCMCAKGYYLEDYVVQ